MIEDFQRLHKGDILRNDWAGKNNPHRYVMYICTMENVIKCLAYDGEIISVGKHQNKLVVVGHIKEYDNFIRALRKIKDCEQE